MKEAISRLVNAINNRFPESSLKFPRDAASDVELAALSKRIKTSKEHLQFLSLWAEAKPELAPPFKVFNADEIEQQLSFLVDIGAWWIAWWISQVG